MVDGEPVLMRKPEIFFLDDKAGKAIGINLFIGKRPQIAFGNSDGDKEMLEWTTAGDGARLGMLVLHDDAERELAYGPANGLPDIGVGAFSQSLMDTAKANGWIVISMKTDWSTIFSRDIRKAKWTYGHSAARSDPSPGGRRLDSGGGNPSASLRAA